MHIRDYFIKPHHFTFLSMLLFGILLQRCTAPIRHETSSLQPVLDSLQSIYAPDKRVKLWVVSKQDNNMSIWVEDAGAFKALKDVFKKQFPETKVDLELLPEKQDGSSVSGLINNSVANLRTKPKHSAEMATQALLGTPVRVFKKQGEWYLIQTPNRYIAWVDSAALVTVDKSWLSALKQLKKVVFMPVTGFSYSKPNTTSQTVSDLVMGCLLPVVDSVKRFYKVQYPDGRIAWLKKEEVTGFNTFVNQKPDRQVVISTAKKFLGFPYMWGGTSSKAVDCSGFTSTAYFMNGIILQRDASQQTKYGKEITTLYKSDDLQAGDLLFFGRPATETKSERVTHVALYLGNGEFIHASGKVRINSMDSTKPNFIRSYVPRFVRANRIFGFIAGNGIEFVKNNPFYREIK